MSQIQVVAQYPEHGFDVLEDDYGQFLVTEKETVIPLKDKPKTSPKVLISQFANRKIPAVERAYA